MRGPKGPPQLFLKACLASDDYNVCPSGVQAPDSAGAYNLWEERDTSSCSPIGDTHEIPHHIPLNSKQKQTIICWDCNFYRAEEVPHMLGYIAAGDITAVSMQEHLMC